MYNNGVLGATLGLPAAAPSSCGNDGCYINDDLVINAEPTDIHIP
jgi:hypothetical protein